MRIGWCWSDQGYLSRPDGNLESNRDRRSKFYPIRKVGEIRGVADAKATEIYAKAYNQSPQAVAFYEFSRTMQFYKSIIGENTTLVLSTDSDLFKFLKAMTPDGNVRPARRSSSK